MGTLWGGGTYFDMDWGLIHPAEHLADQEPSFFTETSKPNTWHKPNLSFSFLCRLCLAMTLSDVRFDREAAKQKSGVSNTFYANELLHRMLLPGYGVGGKVLQGVVHAKHLHPQHSEDVDH